MNDIERAIEKFNYLGNGAPIHNVLSGMERKEKREMFLLAANALEKQTNNGWIPVSVRLPENQPSWISGTTYIITRKHCNSRRVEFAKYKEKKWFGNFGRIIDDVIAWQPLPEEYKESANE